MLVLEVSLSGLRKVIFHILHAHFVGQYLSLTLSCVHQSTFKQHVVLCRHMRHDLHAYPYYINIYSPMSNFLLWLLVFNQDIILNSKTFRLKDAGKLALLYYQFEICQILKINISHRHWIDSREGRVNGETCKKI